MSGEIEQVSLVYDGLAYLHWRIRSCCFPVSKYPTHKSADVMFRELFPREETGDCE